MCIVNGNHNVISVALLLKWVLIKFVVGKARSSPGVSLSNIRDHLLESVPDLKERGISVHSIARLMQPPRRKTIAAKRYKGLIDDARIHGKKNCYREEHVDQHYLFAKVA